MHDIDRQLDCMLRGDFKTGWEISEKLQAIGPENIVDPQGNKNPEMWVRHNFNRGWFLLQQGKYQEGSQLLESGRFLSVYGGTPLSTSAPIYNPEEHDLKGKSVILSLEGGYGDEIIHARFATSIKKLGASKVYVAASPEIASVFTRIEGVDGVILRNQSHTVQHDYWIPGFSAGWLCGHTFDDLPNDPYIHAIPQSIEIWRSIIKSSEGKRKVGIRWAGNPKFEHQQFRRFDHNFMVNLANYDELEVYSFQRDHNVQKLPENITDLQHLLISWEDTLAALSLMDIVITSCTSIAHAAAALGKETWVVVPVLPYHIWANGAPENFKSSYYKSVTVYRQTKWNEWNDTFQKLYADLEKKFELKHHDFESCDKEFKKANLGCGIAKMKGFDNIDSSKLCKPDLLVDLDSKHWNIPDDTYDHIIAKDCLEHLDDTVNVIKEMYRISKHGAIWEVQVPNWNSNICHDNPTHVSTITPGTFKLFDMKESLTALTDGIPIDLTFLEIGIDIEVCEVQHQYTDFWENRFKTKNVTSDEMHYATNFLSNVIANYIILIQVHKPPRYNEADIERVLNVFESKFFPK